LPRFLDLSGGYLVTQEQHRGQGLHRAIHDLSAHVGEEVDLVDSYMIGDMTSDIGAGEAWTWSPS
jgi:histidinol phosphatase-like enzyme